MRSSITSLAETASLPFVAHHRSHSQRMRHSQSSFGRPRADHFCYGAARNTGDTLISRAGSLTFRRDRSLPRRCIMDLKMVIRTGEIVESQWLDTSWRTSEPRTCRSFSRPVLVEQSGLLTYIFRNQCSHRPCQSSDHSLHMIAHSTSQVSVRQLCEQLSSGTRQTCHNEILKLS